MVVLELFINLSRLSINYNKKQKEEAIMKKTFLPFLIICFVLLCPRAKTLAQMQSLASPSTEREIANTSSFIPIKSLAISSNEIVTLCSKSIWPPSASIFGKTKNGTQNIDIAFTIGNSILDFDCYQHGQTMFFCGSNAGIGFIGWEEIDSLFSSNTITSRRFDLVPIRSVQKIYYYEDGTDKKLALIGDDRYFIDFNFSAVNGKVYTSNNKLLDIAITDDYVVILGQVNDSSFVLYDHEKTDISNYKGFTFMTPQLRVYDNDIKYHLTELNSNQVMVAFSLEDNRNEHCIIDLNSFAFSIVDDQQTITDIGKPIVVDLEYEQATNTVLCLTKNTSFGEGYIYRVKPFAGGIYSADGLIPKQAMKLVNLADYDNDYFLALGTDTDSNLYFFDKKKWTMTPYNCFIHEKCDLDIIHGVIPNTTETYSHILPINIQSTTISFQPTTNLWDTICN